MMIFVIGIVRFDVSQCVVGKSFSHVLKYFNVFVIVLFCWCCFLMMCALLVCCEMLAANLTMLKW